MYLTATREKGSVLKNLIMKSEIMTVFLLVIITDRSGLVYSDRSSIVHDQVYVTIFTDMTTPTSVEGSSYPSLRRQDYPELCDIIINSTSLGCHSPLKVFDDCTVVYYEEESCNISLLQLTEQVKVKGGKAVVYRTVDIEGYLRRLDTANITGISVILVKDELQEIRRFDSELLVQVNITVIVPPADNESGDDSHTKLYVLLFVLITLLLIAVLIVSVIVIVYYRRHHHKTRLAVSCFIYLTDTLHARILK